MTKNYFLLGVGSQKCGTSWLHNMISQSANVDMGIAKEYHIHDARTIPECAGFKRRAQKRLSGLKARGETNSAGPKLQLILDFHRDENVYYDYFQGLVAPGNIHVTGDFTPSYCGLSAETFRGIDEQLTNRGMTTKVVFLMRDPVERSWSAVRMSRRELQRKNPKRQFEQTEMEQLKDIYASPVYQLRSDYAATLKNLSAAFPEERVFIEFYETLFSQDVINRLCEFVEIDPIQADLGKFVNVSPKVTTISEDIAEEIATYYAASYHEVANRFGTEKVKSIWQSARFVL
ncbi:sulfotransferase [Planktotalea sp.]|uniref:sulfotransferase n=1 Tax=Planktotalea sp. TaxID=2029877 RepID=UPI00329A63BA